MNLSIPNGFPRCRPASALAALLAAGAAQALPLDPNVTRELNFVAERSFCPQGVPAAPANPTSCVSTQGSALDPGPYSDGHNSSISGSARAFVDGLDVSVSSYSAGASATATFDAVQFDQLTVHGPTPTVQVDVKVTITGTTVASNPRQYALTVYSFELGPRSATPNPSFASTGDRIDNNRRSVLDFARTATLQRGIFIPVTNNVDYGSFTATTGVPFEYGFELVVQNMNTVMNYSARVEYSLPAGYTLTSARGLAVNVVPEPASWALMLAGLAVAPLLRRRRAIR